VRKQKNKSLPSGVSPHIAYTLPERYDGEDCLQPVNLGVIQEMLNSEEMLEARAAVSDWGVPEEFARRAEAAREFLNIREVNLQNVWMVFSALLGFFLNNNVC
jgi:hypothetical protein